MIKLSFLKKTKKNKKKQTRFNFFSKFRQGSKNKRSYKSLLLVLIFTLILSFIYVSLNQPIRVINIEGDFKRVSLKTIQSITSEMKNKGFLSVRQSLIKKKLESFNWVKSVQLSKEWPDTINISVIEDDVVGIWNNELLLNSSGSLYALDKRVIPGELIQFFGPEDLVDEVYEQFKLYNNELIARGILIEKIGLDLRGSWSVTVRPGIEIKLGDQNTEERFDRFLMIWDKSLLENFELISYIDLRYAEGFVIKRKN